MTGETGRRERLELTVRELQALAADLQAAVAALRRAADAEALRELALGRRIEIAGAQVRAVIAARRLRAEYFPPDLTDAAWSLLLELFAARLEGRRLTLAGLTASSGVRPTTATRWSRWLVAQRLVRRDSDPSDQRLIILDLSDEAADTIRAYLDAALALSPWVL